MQQHTEVDIYITTHFPNGFPECKGRKYRYPKPSNEKAWKSLLTRALAYQKKKKNANFLKKEMKSNPKFDYVLFHIRDGEKKRRCIRTKQRYHLTKLHGSHKMKNKEIHHTDRKNLSLKGIKLLSAKQHDAMHRND